MCIVISLLFFVFFFQICIYIIRGWCSLFAMRYSCFCLKKKLFFCLCVFCNINRIFALENNFKKHVKIAVGHTNQAPPRNKKIYKNFTHTNRFVFAHRSRQNTRKVVLFAFFSSPFFDTFLGIVSFQILRAHQA